MSTRDQTAFSPKEGETVILVGVSLSTGGKEVVCKTEHGERYTVSLADARKTGLYRLAEDEEALPAEWDGEGLAFLSQKLACLKYAVYLLGFSDKSRRALADKLKEKGYGGDTAEAALAVLEENGVLCDGALCREKVKQLAEGKGYGPMRIKKELAAKGFRAEDIRIALDEADTDWEALAREVLEKLTRRGLPQTEKERNALKQKLARYGYPYAVVDRVTKAYQTEETWEE